MPKPGVYTGLNGRRLLPVGTDFTVGLRVIASGVLSFVQWSAMGIGVGWTNTSVEKPPSAGTISSNGWSSDSGMGQPVGGSRLKREIRVAEDNLE